MTHSPKSFFKFSLLIRAFTAICVLVLLSVAATARLGFGVERLRRPVRNRILAQASFCSKRFVWRLVIRKQHWRSQWRPV